MDLMRNLLDLSVTSKSTITRRRKPFTDATKEILRASTGSECSGDTDYYDAVPARLNLPYLPVEILGIVVSGLSRQDVKHLRLVSKQCEAKVSAHYFKEVVVPFGSHLYGALILDGNGNFKNISATMLSNGGRVFSEFGALIRRFGLSLEIDEEALENPPSKPMQQIHSSFWGLYRWPLEVYSRYSDLSHLEADADEIEAMRRAMRCLTNVMSLGLCSDAGLGFLSGPDTNARYNAIRHHVFSDRDWRRSKTVEADAPPVVTVGDARLAAGKSLKPAALASTRWKVEALESMLLNSGFGGERLAEAKSLLLETEAVSAADMVFDDGPPPELQIPDEPGSPEQNELLPPFERLGARVPVDQSVVAKPPVRYALVPSELSRAQKEMLLELEWAHRAMTQSYVLCTIDCSHEGYFQHVSTLDIAKIPASHLHILGRTDFWASFPSLRTISLGIIADWRRIVVSATGCVDDEEVSPLNSVPLAHALIRDYISCNPQIESFHFEWICGGELAAGAYLRNQHILPAPFLPLAEDMARRRMNKVGGDPGMIQFPHLKHLSLKNCWVAPHVLLQALRSYALNSLEKVEFEGVSLSAMPGIAFDEHPPPLVIANLSSSSTLHSTTDVLMYNPHVAHFDWDLHLKIPSWLSWAGLIEHFSPSVKVRDAISRTRDDVGKERLTAQRLFMIERLRSIIPDAGELSEEEGKYKLKLLSFKSCGYVSLAHPAFNIDRMVPVAEMALFSDMIPLSSSLTPLMQRCKDKLMGVTMPFAMLNDRIPFLDVFELKMGWLGIYEDKILRHAQADGCRRCGAGRFSGTVCEGGVLPPATARGRGEG